MARICVGKFFLGKALNFDTKKVVSLRQRNLSTNNVKVNRKDANFKVRALIKEDIPQIIQMRRRNNFYDAVSSYTMCLDIDPKYIIVVDNGYGKVIGTLSCFINTDEVCTAGLRTVHEDYRDSSITTKLTYPRLLEIVAHRAYIGHGEIGAYHWNIKKMPFFEDKFMILDYECPEGVNPDNLSSYISDNLDFQEFKESHLTTILQYDQEIIGFDRKVVVSFNCKDPYGKTLVALRDEKCVGYGTIKLNIQGGGKLGPLYADEPAIAEALLKKLIESFELGKGFSATIVSNNVEAVRLFEKLGEMKKLVCFRTYSKPVTAQCTKNIYGLFDLEFQPF